ncbi:discoidin domain-containing protein [bacterium]|nr:MAG: discoidin domain-containing protein [bacterium]
MKRLLPTLFLLGLPVAANAQTPPTDTVDLVSKANGGRIISTTSTLDNDPAYSADNLIDGQVFSTGNTKSRGWASNKFDPITRDSVTLGFADNRQYTIGRLVLNPATDLPPERWAKDVEVQVSTASADGPYDTVAQLTLKQSATPQEFSILATPARFVRLVFRSNYGSDRAVALGEVEIYEAIDTSDPMGGLISRLEGAINDLKRYRDVQTQGGNGGGQKADVSLEGGLAPATLQMVQLLGTGDAQVPIGNSNLVATKNGGKVMAYSSIFDKDAQFGPDKLIDGSNFSLADNKGSFGWASQGFAPGREYVTLGFAQDRTRLIGKIVLNPTSNQSDLRWARRVQIQATTGSFKDGPWKEVAVVNLKGQNPVERGINQEFLVRPVEAKYLRFIFLANGPGIILPDADPNVNSDRAVSLGEIEVYEAATSNDQLGALISKFTSVLTDLRTLRRRALDAPADTN